MDLTTATEQLPPIPEPVTASPPNASGQPALATVAGTQCTNCAAQLAADQRYCVECGQRCVQSTLPYGGAARAAESAAPAPAPRRSRLSANGALIAGVGTLLLAMGVGVLIGHSGKDSSARSGAPSVVTVAAPTGAAATAAAAGAGAAAGASNAAKTAKKSAAKASTAKVPKEKAVPKAVVKKGTPGKGPGYQNGKFTGNFFGP